MPAPSPPRPPAPTVPRLAAVDAARGLAVAAMVAYHFCWDLDFFGFARFALTSDPLWLAARTAIVSAFLLLVGYGLVLATARGLDRRRYGRRLGVLAAAAAAVSAVSYVGFPESPIFFGVLHHILVASVLGLAAVPLPAPVTAALGAAVLALPAVVGPVPAFDAPWLRWIGLMSHAPDSNDYVPLVPWFGVVLLGVALARLRPPRGPAPARPRPLVGALARVGRHSLAVYLLHQPVLFGALWLAAATAGATGGAGAAGEAFLENCAASCRATGGGAAGCIAACGCVADDLRRAGLWEDTLADRLDAGGRARSDAVVAACLAAPAR
ncbi:heparan-alpha-glucosaminide N-acetyltransferase [Azospirillum sp. ST 5-10]|uniref:heparan-alpha-glucosaminide N-acetyltransferase n=1 Tax=Azospirillum sp. ST 5-10 TaxID=3445776 RepID=UPI003F4A688B